MTAVIGACLGAGVEIETACRLANEAAGLVVEKRGTATVSARELRRAITGTKFECANTLPALVKEWRASGYKIGFTNGLFDLLHPGHLHLLRQAKATCDRLRRAAEASSFRATIKRSQVALA